MKSSYFEIKPLAAPYRQFEYSVSWPNLGSVNKHRGLMVQWAFDTGAFQVAFGGARGQVLYVDASVYYTQKIEDIVDLVMEDLPDLTAVAFEERGDAEKFIESAEKHIMWNQLKKKQGV
jgi:hypothetical protein